MLATPTYVTRDPASWTKAARECGHPMVITGAHALAWLVEDHMSGEEVAETRLQALTRVLRSSKEGIGQYGIRKIVGEDTLIFNSIKAAATQAMPQLRPYIV